MLADPVVVPLPETAGIHQSAAVAAELVQALGAAQRVRVDSSGARAVDLAMLQVLIAAHRQAARDGKVLEVTVPTGGAVALALASLGIDAAADAELAFAGDLWTGVGAATGQA